MIFSDSCGWDRGAATKLQTCLAADATIHFHSRWLTMFFDSIGIRCGLYVLL